MNTATCLGDLQKGNDDNVWHWCDTWYSFFPDAVQVDQKEPQNPTYKAGDCADEGEFCYASSDACESHTSLGCYPIFYLAVTRNNYHGHEKTLCANCAMKLKRDARLRIGDFSGTWTERLVKMLSDIHYEGGPIECEGDGCDVSIESAYGDPDDEDESECG